MAEMAKNRFSGSIRPPPLSVIMIVKVFIVQNSMLNGIIFHAPTRLLKLFEKNNFENYYPGGGLNSWPSDCSLIHDVGITYKISSNQFLLDIIEFLDPKNICSEVFIPNFQQELVLLLTKTVAQCSLPLLININPLSEIAPW